MLDLVVQATGCARPTTCPRAVLESAPRHVREITTAVAVMDEYQGAVSLADALGRDPLQVDLEALRLLTLARRTARAHDDRLREEERKTKAPATP